MAGGDEEMETAAATRRERVGCGSGVWAHEEMVMEGRASICDAGSRSEERQLADVDGAFPSRMADGGRRRD